MAAYQTRQKRELLEFFRRNPERSYTIEEVMERLHVGRSTAYRLMPEFVAEGALRRFSPDGGRGSRYQYVGPACAQHLHLKCTGCGELFHLEAALTESIFREIWESVHLALNKEETVLLGTCEKCSKT